MNFKTAAVLFLLVVGWVSPASLQAASNDGRIFKVIEGDILEVRFDNRTEQVRLARIDAPEKDQPFWKIAINFVSAVAGDQVVTVRFEVLDLYGRPLGEVFLADGNSLNRLLVEAGYAWDHEDYSRIDDSGYAELENSARSAGRGLWQDANPVPPWEWQWLQRQLARLGADFRCGEKRYCTEMSSCEEAKLYMYACGTRGLDPDNDGVPCDNRCK